uniref:rRNA-processing protein EBP2 n=1 Tax=Rhabditophanes sp. KR3021 TaxID=114890 RepID=A0AC35UEA3_9BILA
MSDIRINKVEELKAKLVEMQSTKLPWIETMDVTVAKEELLLRDINDDFKRELVFYNQAIAAAKLAIPRLQRMKIPVFRPSDYFAEMTKSDEHMQKIRTRLLDMQKGKERQETIRRLREEKKFAVKVQKKSLVDKQKEKKKFNDAVKKHKKGMKGQLEAMLNNAEKLGYGE